MNDFVIGYDNLLERVDEYTLYCHYLGYNPEIKVNYSSPFRDDDASPSFGIFPCRKVNREYMWKDSGGMGDSGDVVKLVRKLYGLSSLEEAVDLIKSDFGLGLKLPKREKVIRHQAPTRSDIDIRIKPREFKADDFEWWNTWNVSKQILIDYRVSPLYSYWLTPSQRVPVFAPKFSYVYRIYNRYQLYFPTKPKGKKFRMDLGEEHVLGVQQLKFNSDTLIITKSYKDVMCLRSFGYEAISPRSENTPLPAKAFDWINAHYKKVYVLFDNDGKHRAEWYPYPHIFVPIESGSKDISDFTRDHKPQAAVELLRLLIP